MSEFATRAELNGFGDRVNQAEKNIATLEEAVETSKQNQRDLWAAVQRSRDEEARIEREAKVENSKVRDLVHKISSEVARISVISNAATAIIVSIIVWWITKGKP